MVKFQSMFVGINRNDKSYVIAECVANFPQNWEVYEWYSFPVSFWLTVKFNEDGTFAFVDANGWHYDELYLADSNIGRLWPEMILNMLSR